MNKLPEKFKLSRVLNEICYPRIFWPVMTKELVFKKVRYNQYRHDSEFVYYKVAYKPKYVLFEKHQFIPEMIDGEVKHVDVLNKNKY
jgi:hypothetical protein